MMAKFLLAETSPIDYYRFARYPQLAKRIGR
jgi:hypothetical protein